jgi:hypothetical protein
MRSNSVCASGLWSAVTKYDNSFLLLLLLLLLLVVLEAEEAEEIEAPPLLSLLLLLSMAGGVGGISTASTPKASSFDGKVSPARGKRASIPSSTPPPAPPVTAATAAAPAAAAAVPAAAAAAGPTSSWEHPAFPPGHANKSWATFSPATFAAAAGSVMMAAASPLPLSNPPPPNPMNVAAAAVFPAATAVHLASSAKILSARNPAEAFCGRGVGGCSCFYSESMFLLLLLLLLLCFFGETKGWGYVCDTNNIFEWPKYASLTTLRHTPTATTHHFTITHSLTALTASPPAVPTFTPTPWRCAVPRSQRRVRK